MQVLGRYVVLYFIYFTLRVVLLCVIVFSCYCCICGSYFTLLIVVYYFVLTINSYS